MNEITKPEDVNLRDHATQNCPYDAYKVLRDEAPAYFDPHSGFLIVTRYEDVRKVLTDIKNFSNQSSLAATATPQGRERAVRMMSRFEEKGWVPAPTLAGRDDPNHKEMRAMFNEAFRPKRINEMDPLVRDTAYRLIDDFIGKGECNWVQQFAIPLPLIIICHQMGAKEEDMWRIKTWTDAFFRRISLMLSEDEEFETIDLEIEAQHYFQPIFERLRKEPNDTLLSDLVNTVIKEWGRTLNDNELHAEMMADTFVGGSETTTNALSAGVRLLIENKDVWQQLKSDPDTYLKTFVEEVVRLESPVQSLMRIAAQDTELHGVKIPKGTLINVRYAAANRDERHFECPEKLDLERRNAGSHMGFGSGTHHCLGAPLARRELYWGFKALVDRIDDLWFAEGKNDFDHHPHFLLRSLKELHIEFTPTKN